MATLNCITAKRGDRSKPKCVLEKDNAEHMVIRVFNTIKDNYDLKTAKKFYRDTMYIRASGRSGCEIADAIAREAEKYVEITY